MILQFPSLKEPGLHSENQRRVTNCPSGLLEKSGRRVMAFHLNVT